MIASTLPREWSCSRTYVHLVQTIYAHTGINALTLGQCHNANKRIRHYHSDRHTQWRYCSHVVYTWLEKIRDSGDVHTLHWLLTLFSSRILKIVFPISYTGMVSTIWISISFENINMVNEQYNIYICIYISLFPSKQIKILNFLCWTSKYDTNAYINIC